MLVLEAIKIDARNEQRNGNQREREREMMKKYQCVTKLSRTRKFMSALGFDIWESHHILIHETLKKNCRERNEFVVEGGGFLVDGVKLLIRTI